MKSAVRRGPAKIRPQVIFINDYVTPLTGGRLKYSPRFRSLCARRKEVGVSAPLNMFYIDDSGSESSGIAVYGWVETTPQDWRHGLRSWLDFRQKLYASHRVPPSFELHTTDLVGGRGTPSTDPAVNSSKTKRREVLIAALAAISQAPHLRLGTVYRATGLHGKAFEVQREDLYAKLIESLEERFQPKDEYGLIFMDGDGTDPSYKRAHRSLSLATRHVIEDPVFQGSHLSQWVQIADVIAWTTFQHLNENPEYKALYDTYLRNSDIHNGPHAL